MVQMPQLSARPPTASEAHPRAQGQYSLGPESRVPAAWRPKSGCGGALGLPKAADFNAFDHLGDAFSTLMSVLRRRVQPRRAAAARRSHCSIAVLPPHLARQLEASSRSLAPGASAELLELGQSVSV